jgi:two-component system, cell cycle sensor histidine kinase and response regulator CckA
MWKRRVLGSLRASVASRDELRLRLGQQQEVARLGQLALTDVPGQELLDEACLTVAAELRTETAGVLELLPDRSAFVLRAGVGWPADQFGLEYIPGGARSHAGYTLTSSRPVIMRDAAQETRFEISAQMAAQGITSGLTAIIGWDERTYGVLGAHTSRRRNFSGNDVTFVEAVAYVLASALRRRAAEEKAEQAYRLLEAVIEGTPDHVFVKDLDGRFLAVNARAAERVGLPRRELIGRTLHEVMPRDMADALAETDRLVLEQGMLTVEETVTLHGETHVVLTTKGPYRARDGTLLGTFGIAHDITDRKARERELARSEERFRLAQEGARVGTWDVDLRTRVTTWSDGLRTLYGVGPDYPADFEHFAVLLHPDDRERIRRRGIEAYADGVDFEVEHRIVLPDGELRWILNRCTFHRDELGALTRVLAVALDITKRKLADEDLVRSEELLRLAQEAGRMGTWDWNIATDELRWTLGVFEIAGLDPLSYQPAMPGTEHIHPDDRVALLADIDRLLASSDSYYESFWRVVRPSGEIRSVVSRGTVFRNADGTPTRMIGVMLDETERKSIEVERTRLEGQLRQAEKLEALGQLAGGVAHDFNNLLLAIRGYGELALGRLERDEEGVAEDIADVLIAAGRAADLTKQLLAFGRRQVLDPKVLDLNDVVRATDGLLQRVIGDNVELVTTLAKQPVVVKADRGQLERVITNLAVNARDAMPRGGVLRIEVSTVGFEPGHDGFALLRVIDEGSGMDAATASRIFEPFFTTKGETGTGLGLPTVHGIVAQSGGKVVLDTAPGTGSTFSIYLPLCAEELSSTGTPRAVVSDEGSETILVVEDDSTVRSIVSTMLAARGYEIVDAADGEEAILRFDAREQPIPLVICDLIMRRLDGRETIGRIRGIEPATKVLYMSGYTNDAIIRSGGLGPGTGFIQKPFSGDELATRVRELLDGVAV